jgi:hypothetical protein
MGKDKDLNKFMENLELSIPYLYLNRPGQLILEDMVTRRGSVNLDEIEENPPASLLWKEGYTRENIEEGLDGLLKHKYIEKGPEGGYVATQRGAFYLKRRVDRYFQKKKTFKRLPKDLQQTGIRLYAISLGQHRVEEEYPTSLKVLDDCHMSSLVGLVRSEVLKPVDSEIDAKVYSKEYMDELQARRSELKELRDKTREDLCARHGVPYDEFVILRSWGSKMSSDKYEKIVKGYLSYVFTRVDEALKVP